MWATVLARKRQEKPHVSPIGKVKRTFSRVKNYKYPTRTQSEYAIIPGNHESFI